MPQRVWSGGQEISPHESRDCCGVITCLRTFSSLCTSHFERTQRLSKTVSTLHVSSSEKPFCFVPCANFIFSSLSHTRKSQPTARPPASNNRDWCFNKHIDPSGGERIAIGNSTVVGLVKNAERSQTENTPLSFSLLVHMFSEKELHTCATRRYQKYRNTRTFRVKNSTNPR